MICPARLATLFLSVALFLPLAARGAAKDTVLPEKFRFLGLVVYVNGSEVTSLNFKFTVNRLGYIRGTVVKVFSKNKGNTTILTGEEKVCDLRGRLVGDFRQKPERLRSWVQMRSSNGGVVSGRAHFARHGGGSFGAQTKTPGLFGFKATFTKITALSFANLPAFPTPPLPTPFPFATPYPPPY